ncbi:MAG TPA: zinc metalloprotease [Flavisolibacter sp.]|nr:zinc metalloprotease [Flavisolibacter sp.]
MKKTPLGLLAFLFFVVSCQKSQAPKEAVTEEEEVATLPTQRCASQEVLEEQLAKNPTFRQRRADIELHTQKVLKNKSQYRLLADGTVEIPVVVHVIYRTATENISDAQIQSQIDVLNEDFNMGNKDSVKVPSHFAGLNSNIGVRFVLKQTIRKSSTKRSWSTNDDMKFASSGGSNAVDPANNLNLWVVNKMSAYGQSILGYAQFPGGPLASDGVVIGYNYFGRVGAVSSPYNLGRTATHEVGHWLNLNHIWGDATCGNDNVADTPPHNTSNGGCPAVDHRSTCAGTPLEMWMNYMDYTYDQCMYMFTHGQRDRMRAVFAAGGFRAAMAQ